MTNAPFKSGFVAVVGRPNVGKSSLVNTMVGTKVSIISPQPNTTRHGIRGILHRPDVQVVFVDTPGFHRPRSPLGERLNRRAWETLEEVDVVLVVVDATAPIGPGDRNVLGRVVRSAAVTTGAGWGPLTQGSPQPKRGSNLLVVVNKVDAARPGQTLERLATVSEALDEEMRGAGIKREAEVTAGEATAEEVAVGGIAGGAGAEFFPVSAVTGAGVAELVEAVVERLPAGPPYFPPDMATDLPDAVMVAELVREQILARVRDELPHSVACRVTEWEWPRIRCEIVVERESQKAIVIGRGGEHLKSAGTAVRRLLPPGAYLELFVRVERRWQRREDMLDRLGY